VQKEDDPDELAEFERCSKQCHVITEICKVFQSHGGADNRDFFLAAVDMQKFMRLSPVVEVGFPVFIQKHVFRGHAMDLTGKEFWELIGQEGLAEKLGIDILANEAKIVEVQQKIVAEKIVDITKTKDTCNQHLGTLFEEDFWGAGVVSAKVAKEVDWVRRVVTKRGTVPELNVSLAACRDKSNIIANALLLYPAGRDVWHAAHEHMERLESSNRLLVSLSRLAEEPAGDKQTNLMFSQSDITTWSIVVKP
jgi:hypothetical protein